MKSNRNFLLVSISGKLGGAEQVMHQLCSYLTNDAGSKVFVVFWKNLSNASDWDAISPNLKIIELNGSPKVFYKLLKNHSFDLAFSTHLMMNAILGFMRSTGILKTKKIVVRESTQVFGRYSGFKLLKYKLAYWFGYRNIDLVICQTESMKQNLIKELPYLNKRTNVETIPNPFKSKQNVPKIEINFPYVVSAGRLIKEKGFDVLIHAFEKFKKNHPQHKLIILGEGSLKEPLQELINSKNLQNEVILQGFVADVYPYFKQADLCVISSVREGFPNVLLQMMSQNHNVVSTLCAGDIDKIKGIGLAQPSDINDLYKAMENCISADNENNRNLFDSELSQRSIDSFMHKIDSYVS